MRGIRYFTNITAVIYTLGAISLLNEGTLDIYGVWDLVLVILAVYYMDKVKKHE